jgi:hypothetical protein
LRCGNRMLSQSLSEVPGSSSVKVSLPFAEEVDALRGCVPRQHLDCDRIHCYETLERGVQCFDVFPECFVHMARPRYQMLADLRF